MRPRPKGGVRFFLAGLTLACGLSTTAAFAVDDGTVSRFVRFSDSFHAQLPRSDLAGLSAQQRRARAVCILTRFEDAYGGGGVQDLMGLMSVLSKGTEFDDPTVVAFNQRYGGAYDQTVRQCTRTARSS